MSLNLHPEWVETLLVSWALRGVERVCIAGRRNVSPMFEMFGVAVEDDGHADPESLALVKVLEAMRDTHPGYVECITRSFKPWALGPPVAPDHLEQLQAAAVFIAARIDEELGS